MATPRLAWKCCRTVFCGRSRSSIPRRTIARIEEELRKGRIVSTFANMTLLVLGPHHDSPDVHSFDEDMKHYNRQIA